MMVAEKPSIALSIAEALGHGDFEKKGGPKSVPTYTWKGTFKGHQASFLTTSVAGHVFNRDFDVKY